jgi:peptide chain release factor
VSHPLWLLITSGRGPGECELFVVHLVGELQADAEASGAACELLDAVPGAVPRGLSSALVSVEGQGAAELADRWRGTHKWVCPSVLRPECRRKNWFVGVGVFTAPVAPVWRESDLRVEAFRSSGPGGQHANKTSSAVRVTHLPTGLVTVAQEERSQHRNRALALARLDALLRSQEEAGRQAVREEVWREHAALERGAEVAVYRGPEFRRER